MKCDVLSIRDIGKGLKVAHIQIGNQFGDVLCNRNFREAKQGDLKPSLQVRNGRFEARLYLENLDPQ